MTKQELVTELRGALREMLTLRNQGSTFPKLCRAQGFVDGFMSAILSANLASQAELLSIVAEERTRLNGPATESIEAGELGRATA